MKSPTGAIQRYFVGLVAQAVSGMARTLCPDRERASIAVAAALIILFNKPGEARTLATAKCVVRRRRVR